MNFKNGVSIAKMANFLARARGQGQKKVTPQLRGSVGIAGSFDLPVMVSEFWIPRVRRGNYRQTRFFPLARARFSARVSARGAKK